MATSDYSEFNALKRALQQYTEQRAAMPREELDQTARELGELLVTLVGISDRLGVDLVRAAELAVARRAANAPRLVKIAKPGDPKIS
jgi:NTP pyrophosphatase (non-canonical NTP hydrolase)